MTKFSLIMKILYNVTTCEDMVTTILTQICLIYTCPMLYTDGTSIEICVDLLDMSNGYD